MNLSQFNFGLLLLLLFTASCIPKVHTLHYQNESQTIIDGENKTIEALVAPFRSSLEKEMNTSIGFASCDMHKVRPEGPLGNFVADLVHIFALDKLRDSSSYPIYTLLNHGGLRAPINQGPILLRTVYELMPFDNEIVFLLLEKEKFTEILLYLVASGGEPLAGFTNASIEPSSDFWVATSDYLATGGDKMTFFQNPKIIIQTNRLLRDEIEAHIRTTGQICSQKDGRWK